MAKQITITTESLYEPALTTRQWVTTFLVGFVVGATADLFALWLFAEWLRIH